MPPEKKDPHPVKSSLHARNKHRERYDFEALTETCPELKPFVIENKFGNMSIDFFNPDAVRTLNKALLRRHYNIESWHIPEGYLCPPVPGRADYVHHMADVLAESNRGRIPRGPGIKCIDIGVGANCIYPIIGVSEYGWSFIGSDIDPVALANARAIIDSNPRLQGKVELRLQEDESHIFKGIVRPDEYIDMTICNPPFHASSDEARAGNMRKLSNLTDKEAEAPQLNFGGTGSELWTEGGEKEFILKMIRQSAAFGKSCFWFSTLVSKQATLGPIERTFESIGIQDYKTVTMGHGNKTTRFIAWTFLGEKEQEAWMKYRWS